MKFPLVCIVGPTAVGKTAIAIQLAQRLNAEIVSLDSRQIYRQMDIGTAKPTIAEQQAVRHYMIDCANIDESFTAAHYQRLADIALAEIDAQGKRGIIVGGAGLYFRVLIDGLFEGPGADATIRTRLQQEAEAHGATVLHERLRKRDPIAAERIHPNNLVRVIRALEVYELTGLPISYLQQQWRAAGPRYPFRAFGLNMPREVLYQKIESRADQMIATGLIEEVQKILDAGYPRHCAAMQSFGYKEIVNYLDGKHRRNEAIALLKQNTRRFAKRQLTWFRQDSRIEWVDLSHFPAPNEVVNNLIEQITV